MIRSPLSLRINPDPGRSIKDQIRQAGSLGFRGVVLDAAGDLNPDRLSETGRRELGHLLRSVELTLVAMHLPTRRPFDSLEQIEDRLARADRAFAMAYQLGARMVLARVGGVPPEAETFRRGPFDHAIAELGRRADHRGVRLGLETGGEAGGVLRDYLASAGVVGLGASVDPGAMIAGGYDPVTAVKELAGRVIHAYGRDGTGASTPPVASPFGLGFAPGVLDWEEYLGALEEIGYRGFLTVWPDVHLALEPQVSGVMAILNRF